MSEAGLASVSKCRQSLGKPNIHHPQLILGLFFDQQRRNLVFAFLDTHCYMTCHTTMDFKSRLGPRQGSD